MTIVSPSLSSTGLVVLTTAQIRDNLRARLDASPHFVDKESGADSALGQLIDPPAQEIGLAYELLQAVYDSGDYSVASGVILDAIAESRGLTREGATYSTCTGYVDGTVGTVIAEDKRVSITNGTIWRIAEEVTITTSPTTCILECLTTGPEAAAASTITNIVDGVAGWTSVTNGATVTTTLGHNVESDVELRVRLEESRGSSGHSTDSALEARVNALSFITSSMSLSNRSLITDSYNTPGKSFQLFIYPPTTLTSDQKTELANTMYGEWGFPSGIECYGTETAIVTDVHGLPTTVAWSTISTQYIWAAITITKNTEGDAYPTDGDTLVKSAVAYYINSLAIGMDVLPVGIISTIIGGYVDENGVVVAGVPGIRTMSILLGTTSPATSANPITIPLTSKAITVTAYISVTST